MGMGLYWLRAGRRGGPWMYLALAAEAFPLLGLAYLVLFLPALQVPMMVLLVLGAVVTLYLLRDYLPWRPRTRTERILDAALPPPALDVEGGGRSADLLLESHDGASPTGGWKREPDQVVGELRWRVTPDPAVGRLRRATKRALREARRSLRIGQGLRVSAALRRVEGPDEVTLGFVLRGPAATRAEATRVAGLLDSGFRRGMAPAYRVQRVR